MDAETRRELVAEARFGRKRAARARGGMACTSHPIVSWVAVDTLKRGGNACDAALAASIAQTVVEPHMTTITGVLSMLYHDRASGATTYVNGSLNTPMAELPGFSARDLATGRGACVPGWWGGFEAALERHGTRPKAELMAPAIELARDGFEIHPFLYGEMFSQVEVLGKHPEGRRIFMPDGVLLDVGQTLRQPEMARTLERLRDEGSDYFYRGDFAKRFADTVQADGGVITTEDFDAYRVRWQEPAWGTYRGRRVAASPPPDNGGTHVIEALNMIELLDLPRLGHPTESAETLYQLMRISQLVKEEGGRQHDPESHPLPLETILSKDYARIRFELMRMAAPVAAPVAAATGSNHVTVVDGDGNVATTLHSCMSNPWSNGLFCEGVSICAGGGHFLRTTPIPKPGTRASCYVAPNIVFEGDRPLLASGSPSVSLIPNILQNTINLLDFGMDIEESIHLPRFGAAHPPGEGQLIEADIDERLREEVARRDVQLTVVNPWNWHHGSFEGVHIDPGSGLLSACGDPRRAGQAMGL
jgi:gamma-glutamyltranspeptidase / glutathione hydrolase